MTRPGLAAVRYDRRQWLTLAGLALAGTLMPRRAGAASGAPPAAASKPASSCSEGVAVAKRQILTYCATLAAPNAAIHAVRALGRTCPLGPGDPFRLLLENILVANPIGDRVYLEVPVEREGHRNAMLKTLLEKGCEMDLGFEVGGRHWVFRDYVESARQLASYPGTTTIDEHSWTIMAMTLVTPPGQARWTNAWGASVDLQRMIDDTSSQLERDTAMIRSADLSAPELRRDCPVFARACGGLHMLYALAIALRSGYSTPARRTAFAGHMRTLQRRLVYDMKVTDSVQRANVQLAGEEAARITAYDARVKFLGHVMEIAAVVRQGSLYEFSAAEHQALQAARDRLCEVLAAGADLRFERYRRDAALYDSVTTSICHAYNGLQLYGV